MLVFVSNIFMMQTVYYCEEMIRLRVERVKEMLLLSGLQRQRFWFAYFVGHILFFTVSWTISYLVMLSAGMDGVSANSAVPYFVLALCAGPTFIVYGYLLSFAMRCEAFPTVGALLTFWWREVSSCK